MAGLPGSAETIGARLRRLRVEQGLSQRDLSSPGITYAYISRIEAGARQPSVKALRMLARKLGVTPEYLETGAELGTPDLRELRLADAELRLRLVGEIEQGALDDLLREADAEADLPAATRVRVLLGLAAAAAGDHRSVIEHLTRVVDTGLITPAGRPDVYATLGRAYAATGDANRAVLLFESALASLGEPSPANAPARFRYATYLSYALTDLGELRRARAVLAGIAAAPEEGADRYTRVRMHWSLGRLALEQGRPLAALDGFRRAVVLLEETEDTVHLAQAHIACAESALTGGDDPARALPHLEVAERLLQPSPARADLSAIRRMQSTCATRAGDADAGVELAEEAAGLAGELPNELGHALWALAEARVAATGAGADDAFQEAVRLLGAAGTVREHSGVLRAYGRYLRGEAREREALDVFERAADLASGLEPEHASGRLDD